MGWSSNAGLYDKGCRIIIGWSVDVVDLMVIAQSNQVMHVKVIHKTTRQVLFLSFIYATNLLTVRRFLWRNLEAHKYVVRGNPWALMGDFNVTLNTEDYYSGSSIMSTDMNQNTRGGGGVFKKLDRVMGNIAFCDAFQ
ncbi:RNA-directed DNA polymerase, eukaryota, reverse transcriptase zinc-binding domain protein, partial [Tanacetum coccineum]